MRLRFIRHATLYLEYGGHKLIVDPMLDDAEARPAIENSPNPRRNPLVSLQRSPQEVITGVDAVLVTHTHSDHWDGTAARLLPKGLALYCQPEDEQKFSSSQFTNVRSVANVVEWNGIEITRTSGQHGIGEIGKQMAPVSGFVLRAATEPSLYIAGDTIWCEEVSTALQKFKPDVIVVNAGAAQFLAGGAITMTAEDVIQTCLAAPDAQVVAVHMEAINHCLLTRTELAFQLEAARLSDRTTIPEDDTWVN
jgi:L-ascorbate metabolism protein UlaG (beta-lactamase superfamily)